MATLNAQLTTFGTAARASSIGGSETWGTTANAGADDGSRATYGTNSPRPWTGFTFYLTAMNLNGTVPAGATINGISVAIDRRESASDGATWDDSAVYIIKGGTIQTTENKAVATDYTTTDAKQTYGGVSDLWGLTWTADDINSDTFGFAISCRVVGFDEADASLAEIDFIGDVVITYTEAVTASQSQLLLGVGPQ